MKKWSVRICGIDMNITNDIVTEDLNGYYRGASRELEELRALGEADRIPIILRETEMYLNTLLLLTRPQRILEIGTAIGYSALYYSEKCPAAEIYTIEKDEIMLQAARHNFAAFGREARIHSLFGDGQEQIEKLRDRGVGDFDFVFIDAAKSHYKRFLDAALSVCRPGAVIVSDNILQKGMTASDQYDQGKKHRTNIRKMREYVDYISYDPTLSTSLMAVGDGLAVTIYRGEHE